MRKFGEGRDTSIFGVLMGSGQDAVLMIFLFNNTQ
jgi:hypothetical protein